MAGGEATISFISSSASVYASRREKTMNFCHRRLDAWLSVLERAPNSTGFPEILCLATASKNHLRAHSCIRENLQENGMVHPAVHKGHFVHARFEGGNRAAGFWNHAFVDDAGLPQSVHFFDLQVGNHAVRVVWVAHQSGHVAHENQPPGLEPNGGLCGGHVRITVVDLALFTPRRGADDRRDAPPDTLAQGFGVHRRHFSDKADVDVFALRPLQEQLSARENLSAGKSARLATQSIDGFDDLRIDFP